MNTVPKRPPSRKPRVELSDGPPFTVETLRNLLAEKVVRGPTKARQTIKMPTDQAIGDLVQSLASWKAYYFVEHQQKWPQHQWQKKANDELAKMGKRVSQLKEELSSFKSTRLAGHEAAEKQHGALPSFVNYELKQWLANIDCALNAIERIDAAIKFANPTNNEPTADSRLIPFAWIEKPLGWQWIAQVITEDFCNAMKSTNLEFDPGFGHEGPVSRFIAAVVPSVTGEHPKGGSVATQLKSQRSRGKRTK